MSHVERYHGPLRLAYQKLKADLPSESPTDLLQLALHCLNSTTGPEGLCPSLCVFGTIQKPLRPSPAPEQLERARCIDNTMKLVEKEQAERKIKFGLSFRGPYGRERFDLDALKFGDPVRVYRKSSDAWECPFRFISKEGDTVCVEVPSGKRIFRSHVIKPC